MYIQDCVIPVRICAQGRINLPKALNIGPDTDFMLMMDHECLYLVASLATGAFSKKHPKSHLLGHLKQDDYGRILIPARFRSRFLANAKEFWLKAEDDAIQIAFSL